jgi:hypothetical protein
LTPALLLRGCEVGFGGMGRSTSGFRLYPWAWVQVHVALENPRVPMTIHKLRWLLRGDRAGSERICGRRSEGVWGGCKGSNFFWFLHHLITPATTLHTQAVSEAISLYTHRRTENLNVNQRRRHATHFVKIKKSVLCLAPRPVDLAALPGYPNHGFPAHNPLPKRLPYPSHSNPD